MIGINEIKIYCEVLANKDQTGADFTPDEFNAVTPDAVYEQIRMYFGITKNPHIPLSHEKDQEVKDYLAPLLKTEILQTVKGVITLPDDYLHLSELSYEYFVSVDNDTPCKYCGEVDCGCTKKPKGFVVDKNVPCETSQTEKRLANVKVMNTSQWASLFADEVCRPTLEYPFAKYTGAKTMEVAPQAVDKVILEYLKYPPTPFWNYTVSNGISTYSPTGSVNIDLPRILQHEVACSILERIGIHIREPYLEKVAQSQKIFGV